MSKLKKYVISVEGLKYPYCGKSIESEKFLSEKICCYTIKIRKKIIKKARWLRVYGDFILRLTNGVVPSKAIGLPIVPQTPSIVSSIHSNAGLSKKPIIAQVIHDMPSESVFNKTEIDQLYDLSLKLRDNFISQEELITKISNLRGVDFIDIVAAFGVIGAIIILSINDWSLAFQPNPNTIIPPHLKWLYPNEQPGNHFAYGKKAGPRSLTVTGLTQNAGSEKKEPSSGLYNYVDVMKELDKQKNQKSITISVAERTYNIYDIKKSYNVYDLTDKLAEKMYDSIRQCDTDICDIASNLGFKADNIKNVKDHIFYNEHDLDRYKKYDPSSEIEHKCFDPLLEQALAWKRLEAGIHTQDDITWLKHECAERHHELKYA